MSVKTDIAYRDIILKVHIHVLVCLYMDTSVCKLWIDIWVLHRHSCIADLLTKMFFLSFFQRGWFNCQVTGLLPNWGRTTWTACKGKCLDLLYFFQSCTRLALPPCYVGNINSFPRGWKCHENDSGRQAVSQVALKQAFRLMGWQHWWVKMRSLWLSFTPEGHCDAVPRWRGVYRKWRKNWFWLMKKNVLNLSRIRIAKP